MLGINTVIFKFFIFSLIINIIIMYIIESGFLGHKIRLKVRNLVKNHFMLLYISLIFIILLANYIVLNLPIIHLDNSLVVQTKIEDSTVIIRGEFMNQAVNQVSLASVFIASLKFASAVVSKYKMGLLPRIGSIGGSGLGFTLGYKLIATPSSSGSNPTPSVSTSTPSGLTSTASGSIFTQEGSVNSSSDYILEITGLNDLNKDMLSKFIELNKFKDIITQSSYNLDLHQPSKLYHLDKATENASILKKLDELNPDWRDNFTIISTEAQANTSSAINSAKFQNLVSSPLENGEGIQAAVNTLSDLLMLNYVILYLLFMLLFIFTAKTLLSNTTSLKLEAVKKLPLGNVIVFIIEKYILVWQKSSVIWFFFLHVSVIIFIVISIYSITRLIVLLQSLIT